MGSTHVRHDVLVEKFVDVGLLIRTYSSSSMIVGVTHTEPPREVAQPLTVDLGEYVNTQVVEIKRSSSESVDALDNMEAMPWMKRVTGHRGHVVLLVTLKRSTEARCESQDETQDHLRGSRREVLKVVNSFALLESSGNDTGLVLLVDTVYILDLKHPLAGRGYDTQDPTQLPEHSIRSVESVLILERGSV